MYLHALQYGSTLLLEDPARVLDGLSGSSPDVAHPDGHPGYTGFARLVVLLEQHGEVSGEKNLMITATTAHKRTSTGATCVILTCKQSRAHSSR